tara:strand:+ start:1796 stop:2164 length:369 start_codon:yes stop_codon:yes gene_type:complete
MEFMNAVEARRIKFLGSCDESQRYSFDRAYDDLEKKVEGMINAITYGENNMSESYIYVSKDVDAAVFNSMFFKLDKLGWGFRVSDSFNCNSSLQSEVLKSMECNTGETPFCIELWLKREPSQ